MKKSASKKKVKISEGEVDSVQESTTKAKSKKKSKAKSEFAEEGNEEIINEEEVSSKKSKGKKKSKKTESEGEIEEEKPKSKGKKKKKNEEETSEIQNDEEEVSSNKKGSKGKKAKKSSKAECSECQETCFQCNKNNPITYSFTCSHKNCINCLIKSLLLNQFKSLENKKSALFSCKCHSGVVDIPYDELLEKLKENNLPKLPGNCKKHNQEGVKYCLTCELWLCEECLDIHNEFNSDHPLEDNECPLRKICSIHGENTKFFCRKCSIEICSLCIAKNSLHEDHPFILLSEFQNMNQEVITKLKFKKFEDFNKNLEKIKKKFIKDFDSKTTEVNNQIDSIMEKLEILKEEYNTEMETKKENALTVLDIVNESFSNYYSDLYEVKDLTIGKLNYLKSVNEIYEISSNFNEHEELKNILEAVKEFPSKSHFSYLLNSNENSVPFVVKSITNLNKLNNSYSGIRSGRMEKKIKNKGPKKEIKYLSRISNLPDNVYALLNIKPNNMQNNLLCVGCGCDILIYQNVENSTETIGNIMNKEEQKDTSKLPQLYATLKGHTQNILSLEKTKDSNSIISGSEDGSIKIWNIKEKKLTATITGDFTRCDYVLLLSSTNLLAATEKTLRVFDLTTKKEIFNMIGHEKRICHIIQKDTNTVLTASYDNTIKIWDLNKKSCIHTLFGHNMTVFCLLILKDGRLVSGSGSWDKTIKIWNLDSNLCDYTLVGHKREVRALKQMDNGLLLSASVDKTIKVWNVKTRECLQTLISHFDVIFTLEIIETKMFVSGGRDKDLIVWKSD